MPHEMDATICLWSQINSPGYSYGGPLITGVKGHLSVSSLDGVGKDINLPFGGNKPGLWSPFR